MTLKETTSIKTINWKKYYIGVLALLAAEIAVFYYITRQFA